MLVLHCMVTFSCSPGTILAGQADRSQIVSKRLKLNRLISPVGQKIVTHRSPSVPPPLRSRTLLTTRRRSWRQRPLVWRMRRSSSWSMRRRSQLSSVDSLFSTTISPVPTAVSRVSEEGHSEALRCVVTLHQKCAEFTFQREFTAFAASHYSLPAVV